MTIALLLTLAAAQANANTQNLAAVQPPAHPAPLRSVNFRVNPVGLLFGVWGGDVEFGLLKRLTLGPSAAVLKGLTGATDSTYYQFGAIATVYLASERFTDSVLVRMSGYYIPISIARQSAGTVFTGVLPTASFGVSGGYEWMFSNGININLAAGVAYYLTSPRLETRAADGAAQTFTTGEVQGFQPTLEISVGWAL